MSASKDSSDFYEFFLEQLEPMGNVVCERLFGGRSLSLDGFTFALAFEDVVYFKVDDKNRGDYESLGSKPFMYQKKDKTITVSNWEVPADVIEDQDELVRWAWKAWEASVRAKSLKKKNSGAQNNI